MRPLARFFLSNIFVKSNQPRLAVAKNFGGRRCFVACSYAKASLIKVDSLHARPKNATPMGTPYRYPIGTVMMG